MRLSESTKVTVPQAIMGHKVIGLFEIVVFLSCGALCSAQNWQYSANYHDPQNQIPQEAARVDSLSPTPAQILFDPTNQTEQRGPVKLAVSHQSSTPTVGPVDVDEPVAQPAVRPEPRSVARDPQRVEFRKSSPQQTDLMRTVPAPPQALSGPQQPSQVQQLSEAKMPVRTPDLNPTVKQEAQMPEKFEQRVHLPADSVAVWCGEAGVTVQVKQDFLGNGQLITPSDLTLGGCPAQEATKHTAILLFKTELQGCGSTLTMTEDVLIYSFSLLYSPTPIRNTFIIKTNRAEVVIKCHYQRKLDVSSDGVGPSWLPYVSSRLIKQQLLFSLRLMTDDWQSERSSGVYFIGDIINIEASVLQAHHVPLRVYIDSCVATRDPATHSQPSYLFINNHGCLTDSKLTGAKSYFMQRSQEDELQFQLQTFRFPQQDHGAPLYITCHLKATTLFVPIDWEHKACSYLTEAKRWVASGGDNQVCRCCESSCIYQRGKRSLATDKDLQWEGEAALGPILVQDTMVLDEVVQLSELPAEDSSVFLALKTTPTDTSHRLLIALLCGVGAAVCLVWLVITATIIYRRPRGPAEHYVFT